jgi:UDP-glucose 4-epimerase
MMDYNEYMQKNILVTGGAGYIGSHTVVKLIEAGYNPIIVDNLFNSSDGVMSRVEQITGKKVTFINADICDPDALNDIFESSDIDAVIHFAALKAVGESTQKPLEYYQNNISGLINILQKMHEYSVQKMIFSSSCTVYGEPDYVPVDEKHLVKRATSPYGQSKIMGEQILEDCARAWDLRVVALRYFNPIGAHPSGLIGELPIGKPNNLVPYITQSVAGILPPIQIFGDDYDTPDGSCIRDFIDVLDLADAHIAAIEKIEHLSEDFMAINIGTGKGTSVLELLSVFGESTGQKVEYTVSPRRSGDIVRIWGDATKAKETLGWEAKIDLAQSLKNAWNWQESR